MKPETESPALTMTGIKSACDKAPAGPKKDAALRHYRAAEKARTAKKHTEMNKELGAAKQALA
ncbi:hypothetical protein FGK63_15640 [Ruegeria sediminis]|uniref:Uncharacterized protein n=2 Tax=Ruegeria sediminis TaxID=2583820 RepID=A0ABY2WWB6_9RHOB|nr:hypothetical protein FGK63_15640 [Ruegeria sediminis]